MKNNVRDPRYRFSPRQVGRGTTRDSTSGVCDRAVKDKLAAYAKAQEKPWVKHMGKLKHRRKETERITQLIEEDSERIGPEYEPTGWSAH